MPILGIIASSRLAAVPTSYESIATVTVGGGGAADVEFTSIPATYTHLQLRAIVKNSANTNEAILFRFNGDTATNYSFHRLFGDGSSASAYGEANVSYAGQASSANTQAPQNNMYSALIYDVLDYANTNKYKTARGLSGKDFNGSGNISLFSGNWRNTAAVTSLTIVPDSDNFAEYSQFALYGIKGS